MEKFIGIHWSKMPNCEEIRKRISISKKGCISPMKGRKHTKQAKLKNRLAHLGKRSGHWKGGIKKVYGYVYLLMKDHPFRQKSGYIKRAKIVMEKHLGRFLYSGEVVHHINRIRDDDRIENLQLVSSSNEHSKLHYIPRSKDGRFQKLCNRNRR